MTGSDRRFFAVLAAIVVGGAALRFFRLTYQSLWFDELFSVVFSSSGRSVSEVIATYAGDVHPLGYPLMLHGWLRVFGDNDIAARSLSALWGVIGIGVVYLVAKRLGGKDLGLTAALLTAINAFHIALSQEARSYTLVFVFAAVSYVALVEMISSPRWKTALIYGVAVAVAVHIHYYALVMFFGQMVAAVLVLLWTRTPWRRWWPPVLSSVVVAVALLPWIGPFLKVATMDRYWPAVPEPLFFVDYFHAYFGESVASSLLFAGLLLALPLLLRRPALEDDGAENRVSRRMAALVWAISVVASLAVAYVRSVLVVPMLMPRFTFVLLPAILLLIAMALAALRPVLVRTLIIVAVLLLSLVNLITDEYYTQPRKEQWREAAASVVSDPRFSPATDAWLAMCHQGFQYYADQMSPGLELQEATPDVLQDLLGGSPPPPVVWIGVARSTEPPEEFWRLLRRRYQRTDRSQFISTRIERWRLRSSESE